MPMSRSRLHSILPIIVVVIVDVADVVTEVDPVLDKDVVTDDD